MRRLLRLLLVENAALKLVSLILAVTLFVLVGGEKEVLSFVHYKLIYTLPANRVMVSDPATELRVGIRGPWSRVNRVDEQELAPLLVDL